MPSGSYERYGLTGNPFRELASENLEDVTIFHVNQAADQALRTILEEVLDKENRAIVVVTGPQGAGKTQRLRLAQAEAEARGAFAVYADVAPTASHAVRVVAEAFDRAAKKAGLVKMLGAPSWVRSVTALAKGTKGALDPKDTGRRIGEALNAARPSFLLLNDLHNLADAGEVDVFTKTLEEVAAVIKPGVLVMIACYASYLGWLTVNQSGLVSRLNRTIPLLALSDDEARLVIAKKLLAKRVVEELEPTYPFDRTAVHELNVAAHGNPRRLFELADDALERGVRAHAYQIDDEMVRASLAARQTMPIAAPPAWRETPEVSFSDSEEPSTEGEPPAKVRRRSVWGRSH